VHRSIGDRYDSWWLNTPGTVFGALFMLVLDAPHLGEFADLSVKGWLTVIWLGSASSAFIYYALARAMTAISATSATSLSTVVTPTSVLVAWAVLGEVPSWVEVLGGAVVIAGVMLVVRNAAPAEVNVDGGVQPASAV
jgi:DME family drug/metabolite transporter